MSNKIAITTMLIFLSWTFCGCASMSHGPATEKIKTNALQFAQTKYPLGTKYYAGVGATDFENGSLVEVVGHEVGEVKNTYIELTVPIKIKLKQKEKLGAVEQELSYSPSKPEVVQINAEYSLVNTEYGSMLYPKDPISKFRRNKQIVNSIGSRSVFVGMPEEAMLFSLGAPNHLNRNQYGKLQQTQFIYPNKYIYTRDGVVASWQEH